MNAHYAHRLGTPEVKGLTEDEMRDELKLAVYHIQIPSRLVDLTPPEKDSYTWQSQMAYSQLRQISNWATRTLHAEGMRQTIEDYAGAPEGTFEAEYAQGMRKALQKIEDETGVVVAMDRFDPKEPGIAKEAEEKIEAPQYQSEQLSLIEDEYDYRPGM